MIRRLALLLSVVPAFTAPAFAAAEGSYPGVLLCDGAGRVEMTLAIAPGGAARYRTQAGETGSGQVVDDRLVLTGKGAGYVSRYAGEVGGRGGRLQGSQTRNGDARSCQLMIGNGRS